MGCHALLQGIFPTQGSNPGLLHCRQILYHLSYQGSPRILEWVAISFSRYLHNPGIKPGSPAFQVDSYQLSYQGSPSNILVNIKLALQQYVNCEIPDVQAGFRKGRGTRDKIANIHWIIEKQVSSRKTSISALLTIPKPLTVWITINCGKF